MTPSVRTDPLTGDRVIIAESRGKRPNATPSHVTPAAPDSSSPNCPFCTGHEAETPAEVFAIRPDDRPPDSPDWSIRVFPNKFSALSELTSDATEDTDSAEIPARGVHEVIVETPSHQARLEDLPVEHLARVVEVFRQRMRTHYTNPSIGYVQIFKNEGKAAGASLPHPHTQLMATEFTPPRIERIAELHAAGRAKSKSCITCDFIESERKSGKRIIMDTGDTGDFVALAPFASRVPYEVAIFPAAHQTQFEAEGQDDIGLAQCIQAVLKKLRQVAPLDYNLAIRTSPATGASSSSHAASSGDPAQTLHWCVEIYPRSTVFAGFEMGGGAYVNPVSPESAAQALRDA